MGPIAQMMRETMHDGKGKCIKTLETLNIVVKGEDKLMAKHLRKRPTQICISSADTLLAMIVMRLLLPRAAQKYRVENKIRDTRYQIQDTSGPR